jgi:ABC-type nickel/cobalt efflux system permease component RcnA
MITAGIITYLLYLSKDYLFDRVLGHFEMIVAVMLIGIGSLTILWEFDILRFGKHSHGHVHNEVVSPKLDVHQDHVHIQNEEDIVESVTDLNHGHFLGVKNDVQAIAGIGIIHGLASNDELIILLTLTLGLDNFFLIFLVLLVVSFGVIIGMISWGSLLNIPVLKMQKEKITKTISVTVAIGAIIYGTYSILGGEGINLLPMITE